MKVQDVMTSEVKTCCLETSLATVARLMWEQDCGICPVVDIENKVVGVISDRDIAIATKGRLASEISVGEVISGKVYAVRPDEDVHAALKFMRLGGEADITFLALPQQTC